MCLSLVTGCCTSLSCNIFQKINSNLSNITRLYYGLMLLFSTFISIIMLSDMVSHEMKHFLSNYWFENFINHPNIPKEVIGSLAVYRVMSGVFIFHFILSILLINIKDTSDRRIILHDGRMCMKLMIYLLLISSMFILPSELFIYSSEWLFKLGGFIFILLQDIFMISFINDSYDTILFIANKEIQTITEERKCIWTNWFMLSITLLSYLFSLIAYGFLIENHTNKDGCFQQVILSGIHVCLLIIVSLLSVSYYVRDAPNGSGYSNSIYQSSLITGYASYQLLSAYVHHPNYDCHLFPSNHNYISSSVSILFTFLAIIWSSISSGSNRFSIQQQEPLLPLESNEETIQYSYSQFHLMFSFNITA